jgi:hypothetical protein
VCILYSKGGVRPPHASLPWYGNHGTLCTRTGLVGSNGAPSQTPGIQLILTAEDLKLATAQMLVKKRRMAVIFEAGVVKRGRLRADVLAMNLRKNVVIVETKSSVSDYRSDKKWIHYLQYCSEFYFCFEESVYLKLKKELPKDVGIIVVKPKPEGKRLYPIHIAQKAVNRTVDPEVLLDLALRMVYRSADVKRYGKVVNSKVHK